ncbi:MAG TPA: group III truncated hemoglobin [Pseudoxanthomonas sp.]|jgi:hemoglobin|nr:group III truncated hemoglobin [Pseudoxanthomonas sp.]
MRFSPDQDEDSNGPSLRLCSEEEVVHLVADFYARIRQDPMLEPVFSAQVKDWVWHEAHLVAFWSALLRGTRRFHGAPVSRHLEMPGLSAALFERWLVIFRETTADCGNPRLQAMADESAQSIGNTFWMRYQRFHFPDREPQPLESCLL